MNANLSKIARLTASEVRQLLGKNRRGFICFDHDAQQYRTSHSELTEIVDSFSINDGNALNRDFYHHEGLYFEVGKESGAILGAFLHNTRRGAGCGGVRYWTYNTLGDYLCEGMRLSRGMGLKNALAGLHWGGGKGVIWRENDNNDQKPDDPQFRKIMFEDYG